MLFLILLQQTNNITFVIGTNQTYHNLVYLISGTIKLLLLKNPEKITFYLQHMEHIGKMFQSRLISFLSLALTMDFAGLYTHFSYIY